MALTRRFFLGSLASCAVYPGGEAFLSQTPARTSVKVGDCAAKEGTFLDNCFTHLRETC